jgi:hypothetical protein
MNTETKFIFLKSIFDGKSDKWLNDNIIYQSKLTQNDFKQILTALHANKYPNLSEYYKIFFWISYSYFGIPSIKNFIPNIIIPINSGSSQLSKYYMYYMQPNKIFVSFRGTKTFFEALSGIKFYRVPFPMFQPKQKKEFIGWRNKIIKGKEFNKYKTPLIDDEDIELHKGFLDEAIELYNDLAENLEKVIEDKKPIEIILCGHSLGGVLAHIIGIYLGFYMQDVVKSKRLSIHIITANAPPIGNKNFNLLVPYVGIKNFWRFYNFQDFVPHYGYLGTWIESKKFRHLDFMLKDGVADSYNSIGQKILTKIENTTVLVNDLGVYLKEFMDKIPASVKCNNKYIFHDIFFFDSKKKSVFI